MEMEKDKKFEIIALTFLLLFLLILFLILNWLSPLLLWDENVYLGNARSHVSESNFTEDFRFPLLEWLIALIWIRGESLFAAKIFIILLSIATVFFTYLISREYFTVKKAFLTTLCFALSPLVIFWGFRVYADIPALFFTVVSFYCLLENEKSKSKKIGMVFIAFAGIMAALAFLSRFPLALFPLSAGIYSIFKKKYKVLLIFSVFFVLALIPWLAYNQIHYQNPIWDLKEQYSVVEKWTLYEPIIKQIKNLFMSMGLFVILLPLGIYSLLKKALENENRRPLALLILTYVILSFVYYLCFVKLKDARYYFAFLPFLYLIAFDGFFWLKQRINKTVIKKTISVFVILNALVLFVGTIYTFAKIIDYERNGALIQSIDYLKEKNISSNSSIVSNVWPWYGYYFNAKVACLWSENITELINLYDPDYIIYDNQMGTYFNKTILDTNNRLNLEKEIKDKYDHEIFIYNVS
ncbi:MAG: ArnT family glycosyltransferase [Candidatus Nanoarchaeia archaeon]